MALKYTLTLSTLTDPGRPASTQTSWILTRGDDVAVIARGACPGDPHGDHARIEGRTAAKKDATALGLRIPDTDVRVRYAGRPAAATPVA